MFKPALIGLLIGLSTANGLANPVRTSPKRPATESEPKMEAVPKMEGRPAAVPSPALSASKAVDYVKIEDVAAHHGLQLSWIELQRRVLLKNETTRIEIEAGSREMRVDGLKVFLGEPARWIDGGLRVSRIDADRMIAGFLAPALSEMSALKVIAIDPGHGGELAGTQNEKLGLHEKILVLDVSLRLKKLLEVQGYRVVMTRETDIAVGLGARTIISNQAKADLFLSVHFNASPIPNDTKTGGIEVFTFPPQFQRSTHAWSKGEADDTEALPAPVNRFDPVSVSCAHAMHAALIRALKAEDRGQKLKRLGVLRALNCPGVLLEPGFLSNESEGKKIATPEYRQQIAEAIADGVKAYAAKLAAAAKP